jgi:hypothetical protein
MSGLWLRMGHSIIQGESHGTKDEHVKLWVLTRHSRIPPVDCDVVVVRIFDHRHAGKSVKPRFAARGGFEGNLIFHLLGLSLVPIRRLRGYTWRR